jgi:hypothetical protein
MSNFGNTIRLPKAYAPISKNDDVNVKKYKKKRHVHVRLPCFFHKKYGENVNIMTCVKRDKLSAQMVACLDHETLLFLLGNIYVGFYMKFCTNTNHSVKSRKHKVIEFFGFYFVFLNFTILTKSICSREPKIHSRTIFTTC